MNKNKNSSKKERKLATIKRITNLSPIKDADKIECATINGGWQVVVKMDEFSIGDLCLYIEIDAWIPHKIAPFLSKGKEPKEYMGVKGQRLRTVRLRGQISQGLIISLLNLADIVFDIDNNIDNLLYYYMDNYGVGYNNYVNNEIIDLMIKLPSQSPDFNWDNILKIKKYEPPLPTQLSGKIKGKFPDLLIKTDQERIQNLEGQINWDREYQITTKLDGSSMTLWNDEGIWRVCSRNLEIDMEDTNNSFVKTAINIINELTKTNTNTTNYLNLAFQGELMGEGIQKNRENIKGHKFFVFDIFDVKNQKYFSPIYSELLINQYTNNNCEYIDHVPILYKSVQLSYIGINSIESAIKFSEGESLNNPVREGVVFKSTKGNRHTFKSISNKFLLGEK